MSTTYTYGGTALTTYGKVVLINDDFDMPVRRGENIMIPFHDGEIFTQKYYGARTITFGLVMTAASAGAMETLIDSLKTKLSPNTEQTLAQTRIDTTVRNISATVDVSIQPTREQETITKAILTFRCAKPYWRLSTAIADNTTTINTNPKAMTVTNPGTVKERDATFILTGPLQNTIITNSTNGQTLTYTGTIASPRVVTIQTAATGEYTATTDLSVNVIGNITHSGSTAMMEFNTGANTLSIADDTHTTGTVKVSFNAPFL